MAFVNILLEIEQSDIVSFDCSNLAVIPLRNTQEHRIE
jgi:hypothetical protein